ncbi:acetate/propionate family kinase [Consotaella aegiceratis]|uniref:acetate/propionate family kinase n=1 Tax=Consotaella aegiceratis TaxID=3097961 RepID=UPI002F3FAAB3
MTDKPLILVINCGSSSLKFALLPEGERDPLMSGLAENIGQSESRLTVKQNGEKTTISLGGGDHHVALTKLIEILKEQDLLSSIEAVGHRVIHGGEKFTSSELITDEVLAEIEKCTHRAPLHNPPNVLGIKIGREALPNVPHIAAFDTSFHVKTMPPEAYFYAIPMEIYEKHGIRRYGYHGTSHRFIAMEAVDVLNLNPDDHGIVVAHLGNGCSATAVHNGKSVDTSMGMSPLEGLVMGTRSGDIDPAAVLYIGREDGLDVDQLDNLLNRKSGLLGLSGISNDCRTLESAAAEGNERAKLALDVFVHRLARYVGALAMALPRLDALVFTGGIGENSSLIRKMTMDRLAPLGLKLDAALNEKMVRGECGVISSSQSPIAAVIGTNEEWLIAKDTAEIAHGTNAARSAS